MNTFVRIVHAAPKSLAVPALLASVLAGAVLAGAMSFSPPTREKSRVAIGSLVGLSQEYRRAFSPEDDFERVPRPGPDDWLANFDEHGQSFEDFVRSRPLKSDAQRNTLYLQPLGSFPEKDSPSLGKLRDFASAFFSIKVQIRPPIELGASDVTSRRNDLSGRRQLLTTDVFKLLKANMPSDAFAMVGITMEDLYPAPSWNFVFGQASRADRVGVYSFARYNPMFFGELRPADFERLMLRRSCKVLAHETAHMFGIYHCIFYHCLMNGSNHMAESDKRPLHLCPVDFRKLQYCTNLDPIAYYKNMRELCAKFEWQDEAQWLDRRLEHISPPAQK